MKRPGESSPILCDVADSHLVATLSNALISVLDALAAQHQDRPGQWLDSIEEMLLLEAAGSNVPDVDTDKLRAIVGRVRRRLVNELND